MRDAIDVGGVLTAGVLIGVVIFMGMEIAVGVTYSDGVEDTRMEALDAGVAEWPRNGEFKWKEVASER